MDKNEEGKFGMGNMSRLAICEANAELFKKLCASPPSVVINERQIQSMNVESEALQVHDAKGIIRIKIPENTDPQSLRMLLQALVDHLNSEKFHHDIQPKTYPDEPDERNPTDNHIALRENSPYDQHSPMGMTYDKAIKEIQLDASRYKPGEPLPNPTPAFYIIGKFENSVVDTPTFTADLLDAIPSEAKNADPGFFKTQNDKVLRALRSAPWGVRTREENPAFTGEFKKNGDKKGPSQGK